MRTALLFGGLAAAAFFAACSSSSSSGGTVTPDAADAAADAPAEDSSDSASANGPGNAGDMCSFNADCMTALRCECDETAGCSCEIGVRGTGRNGVDSCPEDDGGDQCASAVCIEGPDGAGYFCSDECQTDADCTGMLPQCTDIAFVGRVCVRNAP